MNLKDGQIVEFTYNGATFMGMVSRGGIQTRNFFVDYCAVKLLRVWDRDSSFLCLSEIKNDVKPIYQRSKWENVKVDTPIILVGSCGHKAYMHFCRWEDGRIYLWADGRTSHTTSCSWYTFEENWKEIIIVGDDGE